MAISLSEPYLHDRGDGVKGHYCICRKRLLDGQEITESWNEVLGAWCSAGTVFIGRGAIARGLKKALQQEAKRIFASVMRVA
jgi:hypothetical protein